MQCVKKPDMTDGEQEFVYAANGHAANMLQNHNNLWNAGLLCDITLRVDERDFPCHKIVLISSSSYFKAMFIGHLMESTQKTVVLKDVDSDTFEELLKFIYTSKLLIKPSTFYSLLAAADLFQILLAKSACCQYMEQQLSMDNCCMIYHLADIYVCPELFDKAREFIIANFSKLKNHQDFLNLSSNELIGIISSDLLDVENEEAVFNAVVLWNSRNPEERNANFHEILVHVRLPVLSPYFLSQRVKKLPVVKDCAKCLSLLNETTEFHLLPDLRVELRSEWTCFRKSHAFQEVIVSLMLCSRDITEARGTVRATTWFTNIDLFLVDNHHFNPQVTFGTKLKPCQYPYKLQGIAALESTLYLIGGESVQNGVSITDVFKYNVEYDIWTKLTSMVVPRCQPGTALLYGNIYALGGRNGTDWINSVECYDPRTNTWEKGIDMPVALQHITAVAFKGCIYAAGIPVSMDHVTVMLCYNSATPSWSELPPMPFSCYGCTAYVTNNQICLIDKTFKTLDFDSGIRLKITMVHARIVHFSVGGKNIALESTRTVQSYDPEKKIWSILPSTIMPYYRPGVAVVNGVTFLGYDSSYPEKQGMFEYKHFKGNIWQMEVQGSEKDYVQWTTCAVLQIRKDILSKHTTKYEEENTERNDP